MGKIIAVASGKGGTGKTTTSINLGLALSRLGKEITLVDANLTAPNIGLHLGVPVLKTGFGEVLEKNSNVLEASYLHHSGMRVVPASISLNKPKVGVSNMERAFSQLSDLNSSIIVDTGPGFGVDALACLKAADETLVVTTPDLIAVTEALKTIKIAEELGSTVIGVVLNKVKRDKHEMSVEEVEEMLEKNVIGIIPEDDNVRKSIKMKNPLLQIYPKSKASVAFQNLAANLIGEEAIGPVEEAKKRFDHMKDKKPGELQ